MDALMIMLATINSTIECSPNGLTNKELLELLRDNLMIRMRDEAEDLASNLTEGLYSRRK